MEELRVMTPTVTGQSSEQQELGVFVSFVLCTNSTEHLHEVVLGLLELGSLMSGTKMEMVVMGPNELFSEFEFLMKTRLGRVSTEHNGVADFLGKENDLRVSFYATPWGSRGASRNKGFEKATGDWVYFLDQDMRLPRSIRKTFALGLKNLTNNPGCIWLVGGRYLNSGACSFWGKRYNSLSNLWLQSSSEGMRFLAGNVAMRKACFIDGPFLENLNRGGEETELIDRVYKKGGQVKIDQNLDLVHEATHSFALFWLRLRTHLAVKKQLSSQMKKTKISFRTLIKTAGMPSEWPGLAIHLLAYGVSKVRGA